MTRRPRASITSASGVDAAKVRADLGNDAVTDEHVAVDEVTKTRVDRDDVATLNQDLFGHGCSNLREWVRRERESAGAERLGRRERGACQPRASGKELLLEGDRSRWRGAA